MKECLIEFHTDHAQTLLHEIGQSLEIRKLEWIPAIAGMTRRELIPRRLIGS